MEKNIITAIQHICSKSKQRVTSQRIFRCINKGALNIDCELLQDCINRLEIDSRIFKKKRGKNAPFFINPIATDISKNDGQGNVERVHTSPESPKIIEKLESFVGHDLGNIQNATPIMDLINTPLLYRKDNLGGHTSTVCTDDRFFQEEFWFLRKEWIIKKNY